MVMHEEWLRQWQSLATAWNPSAAFGLLHASPYAAAAGSERANPYELMAEAFTAAVRSAMDTRAQGSAAAGALALQQLSDFLRARFNDLSGFAAIGPLREHQQRWERMLQAQRRAEEARASLSRQWSDTLRDAAQEFARRCLDGAHATALPSALYDEWIDCAEEVYARMAHSEAYCSAQAELLNALSVLRAELQVALELWAKQLDLPTRSELNHLHHTVKTLRTEVARARAPAKARRASPEHRRAAPASKPRRGRTRR